MSLWRKNVIFVAEIGPVLLDSSRTNSREKIVLQAKHPCIISARGIDGSTVILTVSHPTQINRTAASSSVTQISQNGHDEESGEEESEYETETEESEEEAQSPQRPAPIRTGWH